MACASEYLYPLGGCRLGSPLPARPTLLSGLLQTLPLSGLRTTADSVFRAASRILRFVALFGTNIHLTTLAGHYEGTLHPEYIQDLPYPFLFYSRYPERDFTALPGQGLQVFALRKRLTVSPVATSICNRHAKAPETIKRQFSACSVKHGIQRRVKHGEQA